jgi:amino acid adenylation domain-containing protein
VPCEIKVHGADGSSPGELIHAKVRDISINGIGIENPSCQLQINDTVSLIFRIPDDSEDIEIKAVVSHVNRDRIGFIFDYVKKKREYIISRIMNYMLNHPRVSAANRRRGIRFSVDSDCIVSIEHMEPVKGKIKDISFSGMCITGIPPAFKAGADVKAFVSSLTGEEEFTGQIVRNENNETGICFYDELESPLDSLFHYRNELSLQAFKKIKDRLNGSLPSHIVPHYFHVVDSIPLNTEGAVDKEKLEKLTYEVTHGAQMPVSLNTDEQIIKDSVSAIIEHDNVHSLNVATLLNNLPGDIVKKYPMLRLLYKAGIETKKGNKIFEKEEKNIYSLTHAQKRIWYAEKLFRDAALGNIVATYKFPCTIDVHLLEQAVNYFVKENDSCRIRIIEKETGPVQYVERYRKFHIDFIDFHSKGGQEEFNKWTKKITSTTLYKENSQLYYFASFVYPTGEYGLLLGFHHSIYDGISSNISVARIYEIYQQLCNEAYEPIESPSYIDYIAMEDKYMDSKRCAESKEYWINKLKTYTEHARLKDNPPIPDVKAERKVFELTLAESNTIRDFCREHELSGFQFFVAILYLYIARITNKNDIVLGTVFSNRFHKSIKKTIGMFVSTTPIRITLENDQYDFLSFLKKIKQEIFLSIRHQKYPFDVMLEDLKKENEELTDFIEVIFNYRISESPLPYEWFFPGSALFPLVFEITDQGIEMPIRLLYDYQINLFSADEIDMMNKHIKELISQIIRNPDHNIFSFNVLTAYERNKILYEFNNTDTTVPRTKVIQELFEEQVIRTPDNTAIVFQGKSMTYRELNVKANQLARKLRKYGATPDDYIGILMNRSLELIISIIAILKSGAAFLPLDPLYPDNRLNHSITDSNIRILLTADSLHGRDINFSSIIIRIDEEDIYTGNDKNLTLVNKSSDLAYIIYTSGSTGKPKGVMVKHRGVINLISAHKSIFNENENSRISQVSSIGFDALIFEILPCLSSGGTLVIMSNEDRMDPYKVKEWLINNEITLSFQSTIITEHLLEMEWPEKSKLALKCLRTAGDRLTKFPPEDCPFDLYNLYGPTECTVWATSKKVSPYLNMNGKLPTIGVPINNVQIYILDPYNKLQPINVPGELCIAGEGVSRGYFNNKKLTNEKFINNPFGPGKMYKTGDSARWLPSGEIEFLGRIDFQVQIHGYRVELGEIENQIKRFPGVQNCIVLAKTYGGDDIRLAAYIIEDSNKCVNIKQLKESLITSLPHYMVPPYYAKLISFPVNHSGKIDRKSLSAIEVFPIQEETYIEAHNEIEKQLTDIWLQILKLKKISVNYNFYEAGGNSLKLIELNDQLKKKLSIDIPVITLFKYPTIQKQAAYISKINDIREIDNSVITAPLELEKKVNTADIAVIGLAGRFPGAKNIDEFWNNLVNGKESITFFSDEELLEAGLNPELVHHPSYVKAKGVLDDFESFDADFFGYTRRDALRMDPQVRIFHEVVYTALENAGYVNWDGKIGLFAGASKNFYWQQLLFSGKKDFTDIFPLLILNSDFLCTRVAYKLNLRGPAFNVQTACSTSLVAVDVAVHSLLNNDCDIALAGGVSVFLPHKQGYLYKEGFTLSPDGHCRAFDALAGGMVPGEGAGVVVLKPLHKALVDNDTILGVIKGSATNNDGCEKIGYTAPGIQGQTEVIQKAMKRGGIDPESVSYIETHGTGTNLGDPVEIEGLESAFATSEKQYCRIGSVKTNIGHLDSASGIAGFIKAVLMLHHKKIPPSLHYESPNPKINFEKSPFFVNNKLIDWERRNGNPLRAGVSSFGIGGTNAHVILEEAPFVKESVKNISIDYGYKLLVLSAKTEKALEQSARNMYEFLHSHPDIDFNSVIYTLQVGRRAFDFRRIILCRNREEALQILEQDYQGDAVITGKKTANEFLAGRGLETVRAIIKELSSGCGVEKPALRALGEMWCRGIEVDWNMLYQSSPLKRLPLPSYPFEKNYYKIDDLIHEEEFTRAPHHVSSGNTEGDHTTGIMSLSKQEAPENIYDVILEIWKKSLGRTDIKPGDNYFDLGGDSLLAIQIVQVINTRLDIHIAPHILLELQTIEDLVKELEKMGVKYNSPDKENKTSIEHNVKKCITTEKYPDSSVQSIITLKKGKPGHTPLFLIHPVTGTVYFYRDLAKHLSPELPVYGIQARGVDGRENPILSLHEMAETYIDMICQIQEQGPYYLGGSSLGGCIAYEMALQLQNRNKDIGALFMIDTPGPHTRISGLSNDLEVMAYYLSYDNGNYKESLKKLSEIPAGERFDYFLRQKSQHKEMLFTESDREKVKQSIKLTRVNMKAMEEYYMNLSTSFKGKVIFFSATQKSYIPIHLENGWDGFFSGECHVREISGNHITINSSPCVEVVADYLQQYIHV